MSSLAFSQSGYPKKIVLENKDTIIALTGNQVKKINLGILKTDYYKELSDSLLYFSKRDSTLIFSQKNYIDVLNNQLILERQISIQKDTINLHLNKQLIDMNKQLNKQKVKIGILGGVSTVLVGVIIGILINR